MTRPTAHPLLHRPVNAVCRWPVWELRGWLRVFVLAIPCAEFVALAVTVSTVRLHGRDLEIFFVLLACNAITVELTRGPGEPAGLVRDVNAVWELPLALLLPPFYALLVPIPRMALVQWRVRKTLAHRRVFTASAVGLSYGAASLAFHAFAPALTGLAPGSQARLLAWFGAALAAGLIKTAVNRLLVVTVVKGSDPATSIRAAVFTRESLFGDAAELAVAVILAHEITGSPLLALAGLPFVPLLHRSLRHSQLLDASRVDAKTGLLNAATWQREARLELARAVRTRTPAAVAMVDIDHFKQVNDAYGHLAGDAVLAAIARTLRALLRDYDITGRFGGEEFALLLPHTTPADAHQITERLREKIAEIPIAITGSATQQPPLHVTISIGVATLQRASRDLNDLLAAADHALYRAKNSGRNRVSLSAESSR